MEAATDPKVVIPCYSGTGEVMEISYSSGNDFTEEQLQDLFLSVNWTSGNFPGKLKTAMKNSHKVLSAWDADRLVGLINCISDGAMTAYFHYLLVRPEYQMRGIGTQLVRRMLDEYKDYAVKVLIAYEESVGFYLSMGFNVGANTIPMFLTDLKL